MIWNTRLVTLSSILHHLVAEMYSVTMLRFNLLRISCAVGRINRDFKRVGVPNMTLLKISMDVQHGYARKCSASSRKIDVLIRAKYACNKVRNIEITIRTLT